METWIDVYEEKEEEEEKDDDDVNDKGVEKRGKSLIRKTISYEAFREDVRQRIPKEKRPVYRS